MLRRDPALTDKANDIFRDDNAHASKQPKLKISNLNPYLNEIEVAAHLHRDARSSARTSTAPKRPCTRVRPSPSGSRKKASLLSKGSCSSGGVNLYRKKYQTSPPFNASNRQGISSDEPNQWIGTTTSNFPRRSKARRANPPPTIFLMNCIPRFGTG